MNIKVDALATARGEVERLLARCGDMIGDAIAAAAELQSGGAEAAHQARISPGLIGEVFDFAGRMQADLGHAALMLQGVHASLHEALERLAPSDDPQKAGGGGGKEPPPKP